jgi:predicted nuclease of predicted toxin-antitoxin system
MQFKTDENVPIEIAVLLSASGHNAKTATDQGLRGASDPVLFVTCKEEHRVLVTLDSDFGDIRVYPYDESPGIIVLRLRNQGKSHVMSIFHRLLPLIDREPLRERLWIVEESKVRIRGKDEVS